MSTKDEISQSHIPPLLEPLTFDSHTLRAFVGVIAFLFPWVVTFLARGVTSSISASYYTGARDVFVGALAAIGILLIGYKGYRPVLTLNEVGWFWRSVGGFANAVAALWHEKKDYRIVWRQGEEDTVSTIGGLAALMTALFPTACDTCDAGGISWTHYTSAVILFLTVVYFCHMAFLRSVSRKLSLPMGLCPFLKALFEKNESGLYSIRRSKDAHKVLRGCIYVVSGFVILIILLLALLAQTLLPLSVRINWHITFVAEASALTIFGVAWTTACQKLGCLLDQDERGQKPTSGVDQLAKETRARVI